MITVSDAAKQEGTTNPVVESVATVVPIEEKGKDNSCAYMEIVKVMRSK